MPQNSKSQPEQELADAMLQRAVALWGNDYAEQLLPHIKEMAGHLHVLSTDLSDNEVEPGFFL